MGLRFQKRVKLLPGVTLNFSKSGVSTSFGVRGARMTVGHGRRRTTVGLPGSGLSYTKIDSGRAVDDRHDEAADGEPSTVGMVLRIMAATLTIYITIKVVMFILQ